MTRHVCFKVMVSVLLALGPCGAPAEAGGKSAVGKAAIARLLERDAARDAAKAAEARALAKPTTVWRYTSAAQARQEARAGIEAGRHFAPKVTPGRPPSRLTAQRQYGLPTPPEVRARVQLDSGTRVLRNKAMGGEPGRGEVLTMEHIPASAIRGAVKLGTKP